MQSDSNKTPASSRQLQPKHVTLASTPLIGQPLIPRLPAPTSVSTVQNIGQVFRQQGQQGMYVQGLFQTGQIGAQAQRAPSMAFGVYQHPATLYSGSVAQQRQLSPRIPSYQGTSQPGFQQALPGMISGVGLALPGQAISGTNMMPSGKFAMMLTYADPENSVRGSCTVCQMQYVVATGIVLSLTPQQLCPLVV